MNIASILFNTNRAVSTSEDSWESVRESSHIRFGKDEEYYTVGNTKKLFFIKDFEVLGPKTISISDDVGITLLKSDCLTLTYKEYELLTVIKPSERGKGYKAGDVVSLEGGQVATEVSTGLSQGAAFQITQVGNDGEILQIKLNNKGKYVNYPPVLANVLGGSGEGAVLQVEYKVLDDRSIIEKSVVFITRNSHQTVIELDSALPVGVPDGKLSVAKWQIFLTSPYVGDNKISEVYEINRDFSPNLKIPYITKGSANGEGIYNKAIRTVDEKLAELELRIAKLESKNQFKV